MAFFHQEVSLRVSLQVGPPRLHGLPSPEASGQVLSMEKTSGIGRP